MRNIVLETTIFIFIIILTIIINININSLTDKVDDVNIKYDSIVILYNKLQLADSLKSIHLHRSFYLDADSVTIDVNGYFRAKYYKQYKLNK